MNKVFISYCWGKYDNWIEELAVSLSEFYDVIFDKWEIKHGHNLNFFMEDSIRKSDKVLVLCDSAYTLKANERISGVGVETSIISSKVYRETNQEKFIPIFLEGLETKPDYMSSIYGITVDTEQEINDEKLDEFHRAILGQTISQKPIFDKKSITSLTIKPSKVYTKPITVNPAPLIDKIKQNILDKEVYDKIIKTLNDELISKFIVKYKLLNFGLIILKLDESEQINVIESMYNNYAEATGYMGWENYDLFGKIAYDIASKTGNSTIREKSISLLKGCADVRYNLQDLLDDVTL